MTNKQRPFLTGQSWCILTSGYTAGSPEQGFRRCFTDRVNQSLILSARRLDTKRSLIGGDCFGEKVAHGGLTVIVLQVNQRLRSLPAYAIRRRGVLPQETSSLKSLSKAAMSLKGDNNIDENITITVSLSLRE